jgi:hypothetical protein
VLDGQPITSGYVDRFSLAGERPMAKELSYAGVRNGEECWVNPSDGGLPVHIPSALILVINGDAVLIHEGQQEASVWKTRERAEEVCLAHAKWSLDYHQKKVAEYEIVVAQLAKANEEPVEDAIVPLPEPDYSDKIPF